MKLPWQRRRPQQAWLMEDRASSGQPTVVSVVQAPKDEPPPTFREELRALYDKYDGRITSVQAFRMLDPSRGVSWRIFHEEWYEMKRERN